MSPPDFKAVAAMAANRVIGRNGRMPWHFPEDMEFFRKVTWGHPVIMGRRTWESLSGPLKNRRNIVLSRSLPAVEGAEVIRHPDEIDALGLAGTVFVIGGSDIYRLLLPRCSELYLTVLHEPAEGDTFFPPFEDAFTLADTLHTIPGKAEFRLYRRNPDRTP